MFYMGSVFDGGTYQNSAVWVSCMGNKTLDHRLLLPASLWITRIRIYCRIWESARANKVSCVGKRTQITRYDTIDQLVNRLALE